MKEKLFLASVLTLSLFTHAAFCDEIIVNLPTEDSFVIEVNQDESLDSIMGKIGNQLDLMAAQEGLNGQISKSLGSDYSINFAVADSDPSPIFTASGYSYSESDQYVATSPRVYNIPVSASEKSDLHFIVTTLANASWVKILKLKSALKTAGSRLDNLHPLRFLMCIFTDEEMKVGVYNIRHRSLVWKDFFGGLNGSMNEETARNNLNHEYIQDFCNILGIDISLVEPTIRQKRWEDLVDVLIQNVPRQNDPNRFDM